MIGKFQVGQWMVDPGLNAISSNGTTVRLEPKVMEVLVCLASRPSVPISKQAILQMVWPATFVSEDVLTRSISELRRVLQDDAREPRFIETIPKRGYRLLAHVERVDEPPANLVRQGVRSGDHTNRHAWIMGTVSICVTVALILVLFHGTLENRVFGNNIQLIHSVAVLPLQNLSDDPREEYFAQGITDALITDLAQISALSVVSRTTVLHYGRADKPLPQIAHELNVDGIVEGTVQRSGDRVRITAQLIYGPTDEHLWASSFERDVRDVFDVENAVAREIASQIRVKVTRQDEAKLANLHPVNPKAMDAYVEARFHLANAGKMTFYKGKEEARTAELRKAFSYLDQALTEDPAYTPAYIAYFSGIDDSDPASPEEFLLRAKAALIKCLHLDESNSEVHMALGKLLMRYEYDWPGAEREYKRALELHPDSADAHFQYSEFLRNEQRNEEGDKEFRLAQALNPAHDYIADATTIVERGQTLERQRQLVEEQNPNDPFSLGVLGKSYAMAGNFQESVNMYERCLVLYGWDDLAGTLKRSRKSGPKFALEEWMRAAEQYDKQNGDMPVVPMAFTYSSLGNKDRAFAWLDKAVEQRNWMIIYLKRDEVWSPLRSDPRFSALLRRVGLPE